jgi:hypothetical protein
MKSAIVLVGPHADWDFHKEAMDRVVSEDGTVNMGAAMLADPGIMSCPNCDECFWSEGYRVRCTKCDHVWTTSLGKLHGFVEPPGDEE